MKVYIDLVIILNFLFDFVLLWSVNYILRRNIKIGRIILGSLVGELSIIVLFISSFLVLIKLLISFLIIYITFGYRDIKYFLKNVLYFYLVSSLMGGCIYFLKYQLSVSYLIILIVAIIVFRYFILSFSFFRTNYSNYYNVKVFFKRDEYVSLNGFLDTGNKLVDPYGKRGIILVSEDKLGDINLVNPLYVPYHSLNNEGILRCYRGYKIEVNGKEMSNFLVGVSDNKFYLDGIDCVLNLKIMEGLN